MKYQIDTIIMINNCDWRIAEFRMGRGREWVYTLANENMDGGYDTICLNETAIEKIMSKEPQGKVSYESKEKVFV